MTSIVNRNLEEHVLQFESRCLPYIPDIAEAARDFWLMNETVFEKPSQYEEGNPARIFEDGEET